MELDLTASLRIMTETSQEAREALARCLREAADRLTSEEGAEELQEWTEIMHTLRDVNGNRIGHCTTTEVR